MDLAFLDSQITLKKEALNRSPIIPREKSGQNYKKRILLRAMVYPISGPICLPPTGGIVPFQRPLLQKVEAAIEVSYEETGLNLQNGEKASNYDRRGNLEVRQSKGLFIDEIF
jgi:hypothetical protein